MSVGVSLTDIFIIIVPSTICRLNVNEKFIQYELIACHELSSDIIQWKRSVYKKRQDKTRQDETRQVS